MLFYVPHPLLCICSLLLPEAMHSLFKQKKHLHQNKARQILNKYECLFID